MKRFQLTNRYRFILVGVCVTMMTGCASVNVDRSIEQANQDIEGFTRGKLELAQTPAQRNARQQTALTLLAQPLGQAQAVQLALVNSPAMQALLAENWSLAARAAQSGRLSNPIFMFERMSYPNELELVRMISFGLLDVLTLPQRYGIANKQIEFIQTRLSADVVDEITRVRQAWVRAVAAQQSLIYAHQVNDVSKISAELARRMQAVGNFSKLQRARQQAFYADAATQLAIAQHNATGTKEMLVRALGLTSTQLAMLKLPERLPMLPKLPMSPEDIGHSASKNRLDIKLAQSALEIAYKNQGLNYVTSFTDIELSLRNNNLYQNDVGSNTAGRGYEVNIRLPIFDWGDMQRDAMSAQTLAAINRLESAYLNAESSLRESYSAYRTNYDITKHYQKEVVPLRKVISEENMLRYNGMIIGVFELLADAHDQVNTVIAAINAEQQFWLADAALQASLIGRPINISSYQTPAASSGSSAGSIGH